jgi:hypothetical protein
MNNTAKRSVRVSLLLLVGATLFLGACGLENLDDATYLAQMASADASNEGEQKDANQATDMQAQQGAEAMPAQAAVVANPVVKLPSSYAQMPTRVVAEPTVVTNSGEQRNFDRDIIVEQPILRDRRTHNIHRINKHFNTNTKYHSTIYNRDIHTNSVVVTGSASATAEVLPTTEVNLPSVVAPAVGVGLGVGYGLGYNTWGWRPECARYLSGGFFRNCVTGPYYR